jgi:hypothetical protein
MQLNGMDAKATGTMTLQLLPNLHLQHRQYMDKEYLSARLPSTRKYRNEDTRCMGGESMTAVNKRLLTCPGIQEDMNSIHT